MRIYSCLGLTHSCITKKFIHQRNGFNFYDYPFVGSLFLILSQEAFNTILNHKQHLSVRPDAGVIQ